MDYQSLAADLITRTETAVQHVAGIASETGITFKVTDIVDAVERDLPRGYAMPKAGVASRRNTIESMANDILTGALYEDPA